MAFILWKMQTDYYCDFHYIENSVEGLYLLTLAAIDLIAMNGVRVFLQ